MEMNVQNGQTMVISGMLQAEDSKALSKVPGLSAIPILGELFKSRNFVERTTELVVFVTPYLVDPDSQKNRDLLDYSKELSRRAGEEAQSWSLFD
jgi:pilus assembly protein CpaC